MSEDDSLWPMPDKVGRQELEVVLGDTHIAFTTAKIGSLRDVEGCKDKEGLACFHDTVQNLRQLVSSLLHMHFRLNPLAGAV